MSDGMNNNNNKKERLSLLLVFAHRGFKQIKSNVVHLDLQTRIELGNSHLGSVF